MEFKIFDVRHGYCAAFGLFVGKSLFTMRTRKVLTTRNDGNITIRQNGLFSYEYLGR